MLEVLRQVVGVGHPAPKPFKKTLYTDWHAEYVILDPSLYACDGLSPLPVKEKAFSRLSEHLQSPLGLPKLWKAPKPIKIELFPFGIRCASETG